MATAVLPNEYGMRTVEGNQQHLPITNGTTRTLLAGELAVRVDGNDAAFLGFVANPEGIAAAASGQIDLKTFDVVQTNQVAASQTFTVGDTTVYVSPQANGSQALIYAASDTGRFALKAFISRKASDDSWIEIRMPAQDGLLTAAAGE